MMQLVLYYILNLSEGSNDVRSKKDIFLFEKGNLVQI